MSGGHASGQYLLRPDGHTVAVDDLRVGDDLLGPDSLPRSIASISRGKSKSFCVTPVKGEPFFVGGGYLLPLARSSNNNSRIHRKGDIATVPVEAYSRCEFRFRNLYRLFRSGADFTTPAEYFPVDPYVLGVLLGDGSIKDSVQVCAQDAPIIEATRREAERLSMEIRFEDRGPTRSLFHFVKVGRRRTRGVNPMKEALKEVGVYGTDSGTKFVPHRYLTATRSVRMEILAGLIDTDGSMHLGGFDFISKSSLLAYDVAFLCRSLGMAAYVRPCLKSSQTGFTGLYFRVGISGETAAVPCRLERKMAAERKIPKSALRTGLSVRAAGVRDVVAFTLSGNGRYLFDDFTVGFAGAA